MSPLAASRILLFGILAHILVYPLTAAGGWPAIGFYLLFGSIFPLCVFSLDSRRIARLSAIVTGAAILVSGTLQVVTGHEATDLAIYGSSIAYHVVIVTILGSFVLRAREVETEVLLVAATLYLALGTGFLPIFGLIEWFEPGSFVSSTGAPLEWRELLYFSYVTLTTLGFGDITPTGYYAQAFVSFEAVLGVLFTVVLLARLVALHTGRHAFDAPRDGGTSV